MALLQISEPGGKPKETGRKRAVGIDLGTTHSLVAAPCGDTVQTLPDETGEHLVPSAVQYLEDGSVKVGYQALESAGDDASNCIVSVKRFLGRSVDEIRAGNAFLPYSFAAESGNDNPFIETVAGPKSPVEVSAEILAVLRQRAEKFLNGELDGAVITVPAYFNDTQRQQTRDAARMAGLNVLRLLNEPTAAAVAYGLDSGDEGNVVVFDLGGGTFDVSILSLQKGVFQVLATGGDTALGGDDFDQALAHWILEQAQIDHDADTLDRHNLLRVARDAKHRLSEQQSIQLQYDQWHGELTREIFAEVTRDLHERTIKACRRVLRDAKLTRERISNVVMVGGSTRMPVIRDRVREFFALEPLVSIDPDRVVAIGAGLQADVLVGNKKADEFLLLDVTPLSLGIETMGELVEKIIPRNTTIPVAKAQEFTTYKDGQTAMLIHVVQGERELVSDCRSLARFELRGIPPMVAGAAKIRVTFQVDADGLLNVASTELTTGTTAEIQVKPSYGLDSSVIEQMITSSQEHAGEDKQQRVLKETKVEADQIINALDGALQADADLLDDAELDQLMSARRALQDSLQTDDHREIQHLCDALNAASAEFAARRMDKEISKALRGEQIANLDKAADQHASDDNP